MKCFINALLLGMFKINNNNKMFFSFFFFCHNLSNLLVSGIHLDHWTHLWLIGILIYSLIFISFKNNCVPIYNYNFCHQICSRFVVIFITIFSLSGGHKYHMKLCTTVDFIIFPAIFVRDVLPFLWQFAASPVASMSLRRPVAKMEFVLQRLQVILDFWTNTPTLRSDMVDI